MISSSSLYKFVLKNAHLNKEKFALQNSRLKAVSTTGCNFKKQSELQLLVAKFATESDFNHWLHILQPMVISTLGCKIYN